MKAENLSFSTSTVVAVVSAALGLLVATATGTWAVARAISSFESRLDALSPASLDAQYITRSEASVYHRDLEKALNKAGVPVNFPPPQDPIYVRNGGVK